MSYQEIKTLSEFETLVNGDKLVVVDFFATWCGPCRLIAPKFEKLHETYPDAVYAKVDVDEVPDVAAKHSVRAMPTFMFFKNGEKVGEVIGANIPSLEKTLKELSA